MLLPEDDAYDEEMMEMEDDVDPDEFGGDQSNGFKSKPTSAELLIAVRRFKAAARNLWRDWGDISGGQMLS